MQLMRNSERESDAEGRPATDENQPRSKLDDGSGSCAEPDTRNRAGDGGQLAGADDHTRGGDRHSTDPVASDREFGWRGWVLVGIVFVSFVVVPLLILRYPPVTFSYRVAFLILPLAPAVLLGIAAVWATTRP